MYLVSYFGAVHPVLRKKINGNLCLQANTATYCVQKCLAVPEDGRIDRKL